MRAVTLIAVVVVLVFCLPAAAVEDKPNILRLGVLFSEPTSKTVESGVRFKADSSVGGQFNYEHRFAEHMGVFMSVERLAYDLKASVPGSSKIKIGSFDVYPVSFGYLYHFILDKPLDFYAGGGAAWLPYSNLKVEPGFGEDLDINNGLAWVLDLGLEWKLGKPKRWGLGLDVRYVSIKPDVVRITEIGVKPVDAILGLSYHY